MFKFMESTQKSLQFNIWFCIHKFCNKGEKDFWSWGYDADFGEMHAYGIDDDRGRTLIKKRV